ncbi:ATP-binding cassette domain-containing protein [Nonomuraea sp. MCN248]|uniref:ATP-binding cassette domain-containing protein n=1 Tax=Nonomuraea corallina TaxID=2989783 RepID=A0ABT4SFY1_9ACTN|nr:ATP-binding cassette domain-containing protein [Nonomuraea corallina]MDA0636126.1 ATP-binding cassette domain-containing protein [Nonomuraea corallina]
MIEVLDLTKVYGSTRAVSGLSFHAEPGQVTGFLGPNGAGKSTTMRVILGLHAPTSGRALINGVAKRDLRHPMREVGAMLDATEVQGGRSAFDHLQALAHAGGLSSRRVVHVLEEVGLTGAARKRIAGFSQGMRQRLGIAAALLGDPGVLILDEPVNGLDPDGIRRLRALLRSLAAEGRTVLLSSHLMTEISLTADKLVIISHGRLIEDTTVAQLQARFVGDVLVRSPHATRLAGVLEAAGATVRRDTAAETIPRSAAPSAGEEELLVTGLSAAAIGDAALASGCAVHELTPRRASLEESFLELTR